MPFYQDRLGLSCLCPPRQFESNYDLSVTHSVLGIPSCWQRDHRTQRVSVGRFSAQDRQPNDRDPELFCSLFPWKKRAFFLFSAPSSVGLAGLEAFVRGTVAEGIGRLS